jgi:HK97 family phage major capsid protein
VVHPPLGDHQDPQVQGRHGQLSGQPNVQAGLPETIFGYPVVRMEDVPALAANSYSLAFGDLRRPTRSSTASGIRVLRDPYTSKPFVKFYTTKRTGGGVVNFEAIKLMKFI